MADTTPNTATELSGRTALVTGSSRRIGKAIALALAAAGADVAVHGRTGRAEAEGVAEAIRALGRRAVVVMGDVADPDQAAALVAAAGEGLGGLDILVNNASVRAKCDLEEMSWEEWRRIVGVTLDGAFLCAKAALPFLKRSPAGRIVNIGGGAGHAGAAHHVHVVAAKSGLLGVTKALAHDLGAFGITVNMVSPGLIEDEVDDPKRTAERREVYRLDRLPLRRPGTPDDVAAGVLALCHPRLGYVTGQTLHVNGGAFMP